ncbi:MAG: acyl-CoA dehydrogenase [Thermoleophilaceae bacterium]|jgi:alkylation response protein AidB-like acyl-CoA dehydrogenase|nr:acyl-CoA dehydrogenase [Thermoleophilaceae bacterium]
MTISAPPPAPATAADFTPEQLDLRERARRFVDDVLIPNEELAERSGGRIDDELKQRIRREAIEARLSGGLHAPEHGGQGWTKTEWFVVEEQLGRSTNALSWYMPGAYNVLAGGTPDQIERYLKPALRGELHDAYAVTEAEAGSDPSRIETTAHKTDSGWAIDGEKWFVTYGDVAAVYIVMANALVDGQKLPTLFLVDRELDGIEVIDDPPFMHTYPHGHPTIRFTGVEVADDAVIGGLGGGEDLQRSWFTEERLGIAARGVGSMWRLIEDTTAWAIEREQGGSRIIDYQGVSFPLADSTADAAAGRLLTLEVARLVDAGADPKVVHAKASMAKLFVSEAACRCADRCLQIFGGRGYMRTNVAERFYRELRVDRIWEGTSEIQRLIIARALERRGVERTLH